jgi:hypothetical protein
MTVGHQIEWWVTEADYWLYEIFWNLGAPIGGGGFLMVSGMSAALSYRFKMFKYEKTHEFSKASIRNEYMLRAFFILLISFAWNIGAILLGLVDMGIKGIWLWFVIQTIAISLILAWPLLKVSKSLRIVLAFAMWIGNEFVFAWLVPFRDQANGFGLLFYFLYNDPSQNVILGYFPFLLVGTVIGDTLYEIFSIEDSQKQKKQIRNKIFIPYITGGTLLTLFGIIFLFPAFVSKETFSSHMFIFGIELFIIAFLVWVKDYKENGLKNNYRVLLYYSFYSFSIFLAHNVLYFLFPRMLNALFIWFFIIPITLAWTLLWRYIYKKLKRHASLKAQIGKLATYFTERIEDWKKLKIDPRLKEEMEFP